MSKKFSEPPNHPPAGRSEQSMLPDGWWISAESGLSLPRSLWRRLEKFSGFDA
ncbi:hypothetical protein CSIRO_0915 [Bradyrhizobiaceae bacterium SG-6C]|nr:hypothetical protein CSIRO_0915 [Bradyrhizobiaceae bacterium SG-6C]